MHQDIFKVRMRDSGDCRCMSACECFQCKLRNALEREPAATGATESEAELLKRQPPRKERGHENGLSFFVMRGLRSAVQRHLHADA